MKYRLGDLTVKHWNDWDRVPRDPVSIGTAIASAIGVTSVVGTYAVIGLTYVAISAVTSWALSALAPKPDFSSFGSQGTLVNARDATAPADFVYGEVRKGGTVTYYESTGDQNKYLHQIIVLAGHEVEEIGEIYLNDEVVEIDVADDFVQGDTWKEKVRIEKFLGDQTQGPIQLFLDKGEDLTTATASAAQFVGKETAYLYIRYEYDAEVFANGLPLVTAKVKGKKVYDPRTDAVAYSNNAALCMRDFLTSEYGLNDGAIDDVVFSAAANESDEDVSLDGGGTEKRYTINGIVKASTPIGKVLGQMSTACAGTLFWGSGYWKLKVGAYTAPVKTLTLDDLRGPINLNTRTTMRDSFNGVSGTFNNADEDFITMDYPPIKSDPFKAEDGGDELLLDLPLPFTTSAATAQRLAKLTLYRGREQMTISADFGLEAFNVEVGDIIAFDNDRYGFDGKEFEVVGWKFASNQEAGDLRVNLTLQETSEAAFDWDAEESAIISNNTTLPNFTTVSLPTNLTLTAQAPLNGDGSTAGSILVEWDASPDAFVDFYEVQHKIAADADYSGNTTTLTSHTIAPTISSTLYDVRVRGVSGIGVKSAWVEATATSARDEIAPAVPTSVLASSGYRQNIVNWTNPSDLDLSFVQVYANTVNNSSTAGFIGTIRGTEFVHGDLPELTLRYYWLKSVDTSGNISGFSSVVSATTLADPQDGTDGATGDTIVTGSVFYQTLQASAPSTPSASSYNTSTGTFSGLTSGWAQTQPPVDITDTSVQEWSSQFQVTIDGTTSAQTISFTSPSGAIQVTADIQSDNYVAGSSGWNIERDTGNAEFGAAAIRGTLSANQIQIDNVTLDTDGSGNLIIKDGGVGTDQISNGAISQSTSTGASSFTLSAGISDDTTVLISNCTAGSEILVLLNYTAGALTAGDTIDIKPLQNGSTTGGVGTATNLPVQDFFALPSAYMARMTAVAGNNTVGIRIEAGSGNSSSIVGAVYGLYALELKK